MFPIGRAADRDVITDFETGVDPANLQRRGTARPPALDLARVTAGMRIQLGLAVIIRKDLDAQGPTAGAAVS